MVRTYKVCLVGCRHVGKSSLVERLLGHGFEQKYCPTVHQSMHSIAFHTNYGPIILDIWDVPEHEKFSSSADAIIFLYDITVPETQEFDWRQTFVHMLPSKVITVGNKSDRMVSSSNDISVKTLNSLAWTIQRLLRTLVDANDLMLIIS